MHYYQHHIGDFDRATRHLSRIERSIYLDLIFLYYETEQALTKDIAALCRRILARTEEEKSAVLAVLDEFFHDTPAGWFHDRCEEELADYRKTKSQASEAGKASAKARAERRMAAMGQSPTGEERRGNENSTTVERPLNDRATDDQRDANSAATNHKPVTNTQEPVKPEKHTQRASRLPAAWTPSPEDIAYCREKRPELAPEQVAENFRDYWHAKAGKDACKTDWAATWRTWVRNERTLPQPRASPPRPSHQTSTDKARAWADQLTGRSRNDRPDESDIIDITPAPGVG